MERHAVEDWAAGYVKAWRTPGTGDLALLFAADVSYLVSPWAKPITGQAALAEFWEAGRDGPDEAFDITSEVVAVDGPTAVIRVAVEYGNGERWRDLWILGFDDDGRCVAFEEWPFSPEQSDGH
ncbi:MAG TPA: nuclear transport factor 2 family protein [Acidimicrobiales bacterium]